MKIMELQKKLMGAARANPLSDAVPYAFEKRIMARIAAHAASPTAMDAWTFWSRSLWRAAATCVAITLCLSLWTVFTTERNGSGETLAADLESTVLAPLNTFGESW